MAGEEASGALGPLASTSRREREVNDRLRVILQDYEELRPPSIVVVGEQSSGKSSLLESLSGVGFSTGDGMVTRCPLQLALKTEDCDLRAVISAAGGRDSEDIVINNCDENRAALVDAINHRSTQARGSSAISNKLINVAVYGRDLPMLTLIDLPGLIQQSPENEPTLKSDIEQLVQSFMRGEDNVIAVVGDAARDITTVVGFNQAREVDKLQMRTIGVLTKLDKEIDREDVRAKITKTLKNAADVQLKLGFVGVRNRAGTNEAHLPASEVRRLEQEALQRLPGIPESAKGIPSLVKRLTQLQSERIRAFLPKQRQKLLDAQRANNNELEALPKVLETADDRRNYYERVADDVAMKLASLFRNDLQIIGDTSALTDSQQENLRPLPRIHEACNDLMDACIRLTITLQPIVPAAIDAVDGADPTKSKPFDMRARMKSLIKNQQGRSLPDFMSSEIFRELCAPFVRAFKAIADQFAIKIRGYVTDAYKEFLAFRFNESFEKPLGALIESVVESHVNEQFQKLAEDVEQQFEMESQRTYTLNHYYRSNVESMRAWIEFQNRKKSGGAKSEDLREPAVQDADDVQFLKSEPLAQMIENKPTKNEDGTLLDLHIQLRSYLKVVVKRAVDIVALRAHHRLVHALERDTKEWLRLRVATDSLQDGQHSGWQQSSATYFDDEAITVSTRIVDEILAPDTFLLARQRSLLERKQRISEALRLINS